MRLNQDLKEDIGVVMAYFCSCFILGGITGPFWNVAWAVKYTSLSALGLVFYLGFVCTLNYFCSNESTSRPDRSNEVSGRYDYDVRVATLELAHLIQPGDIIVEPLSDSEPELGSVDYENPRPTKKRRITGGSIETLLDKDLPSVDISDEMRLNNVA